MLAGWETVAQKPAVAAGEWRHIRGPKPTGNNYSPLDQINAENFKSLESAWLGCVPNLVEKGKWRNLLLT
jgi:glucose dehydrogenase